MPFNKDEIKNELVKNSEKDFYSLDINNVIDEEERPNGEVCNIVLADTYSRKSFEPVLKSFFLNLKSDSKESGEQNK